MIPTERRHPHRRRYTLTPTEAARLRKLNRLRRTHPDKARAMVRSRPALGRRAETMAEAEVERILERHRS